MKKYEESYKIIDEMMIIECNRIWKFHRVLEFHYLTIPNFHWVNCGLVDPNKSKKLHYHRSF